MSRPTVEPESVAVVVARTHATPGDGASLARFADEAGPGGEVVLVDASGDRGLGDLAGRLANVRVLRAPRGRLAPVLWRDGLLATGADLVAFSTAQMVPSRGWLAALSARLREAGAAGVGGPIGPGPGLSATARAVALLRYSAYFPPLPDPSRVDPPGDNALYRRARLMEIGSAWRDGFWEAGVHRALRDRGEVLAMAGSAVVTFEGGIGLAPMARQRWAHARIYGAGRSAGLGVIPRLARTIGAPLVPPLLCGRSAGALRARGMALAPWVPAWPSLAVLATAWAFGEAVGSWEGRPGPPPRGGGWKKPASHPPVARPATDEQGHDPMTLHAGEVR